jgi:hypothetical protein
MQEAREAIEQGHLLYIVDPFTGDRSELELQNRGIGTRRGQGGGKTLDDLPPCG